MNKTTKRPITRAEIVKALEKMKQRTGVASDGFLVEVWKYLGDTGISFLTNYVNGSIVSNKLPNAWR